MKDNQPYVMHVPYTLELFNVDYELTSKVGAAQDVFKQTKRIAEVAVIIDDRMCQIFTKKNLNINFNKKVSKQ